MTDGAPQAVPTASPHRQQIYHRFAEEIAVFESAYQRSTVYLELKRATELTAQEYGDRFLIELVQNAHDALPRAGGGRVLVILAETDGENGALYVANTGEPFSELSFSAICRFAHSSKRPGESIGNKGIGFRSVLQISDWPEIYSRSEGVVGNDGLFDGYCFRFARPEDIAAHTQDAALTEAICSNVSPYSLPYALDTQPPIVTECAARGFATVVRLPLRNAQAAEDAAMAFEECVEGTVPLHLFLGRVEEIAFERRRGDATERVVLRRSEIRLPAETADLQLSRVTLGYEGAEERHPDEYLVGAMAIPEVDMRGAIESSISQGKLPEEWRRWSGEGRVSVAATLDGAGTSRLYNYLPMGEAAQSPFLGLLDAPFFAKIDRTSLDPAVPLNNKLLSQGALVCLRMAEALADSADRAYGPVVARLLAWQEKESQRLLASVGFGRKFQDLPLTPVYGAGDGPQRYAPLGQTFDWRPAAPTTLIAAERLARSIGVPFLDPRVDPAARTRLAALRKSLLGADFKPEPALLADWTERMAAALMAEEVPLGDWDAFYADASAVFAQNPQLLQGRRIILDDTGALQPAGRSGDGPLGERTAPIVFLAPVRDRTEGEEEVAEGTDLEIPAALKPFVRYANRRLSWRARDGETSIRQFFVQHRLVRRFGKRELREMIRALLAVDRDESVYAAALEFAYRVVSLSPDVTDPQADDLRLRVPTRDGRWLLASDGVFSPTWGKTSASTLEQLVAVLGDTSVDLTDFVADMIQGPKEWPFPIADVAAFSEFLALIGVKDGLWPLASEVNAEPRAGSLWSPQAVAHEAGFDAAIGAMWAEHLSAFPTRRPAFTYPAYRYKVDGEVCKLPGSATYREWPSAARVLFAQLIAHGIRHWDEAGFWCEFSKVGGYADEKMWASPLLAFLTDAEWVPVSGPGLESDVEFRRPRDVWFAAEDLERPEFLPSATYEIRRAVVRWAPTRTRLRDLLLAKFWDNAADASHAVVTLGRVFLAGNVPEEAHGAFWSVYQHKWRDVIRAGALAPVPRIVADAPIIARRSGRLEAWSAGADEGVLVLVDGTSPLRAQLIEDTHSAMFSLEPYDDIAAAAYAEFRRALGDRARLSSQVQLSLTIDGEEKPDYEELPNLSETHLAAAGELATLFIAVRASLGSHKAREGALERLQQVRVALVGEISLTVNGLDQPAVTNPKVLADPGGTHLTLIVTSSLADAATLSPLYAHPLAELAGLPAVAPGIELALRRAHERIGSGPPGDGLGELHDEVLCYALNIAPDRLREGRALTNRSLRAVTRLLLPVVALTLGDSWTDAWEQRLLDAGSLEELRAVLVPIESQLPARPDELLAVCRSEGGPADVRDRLGLDFGEFNAALRRLGRGYRPILDRPGHESAFRAYLARMHGFVDDEIRRRFWRTFEVREDLTAYLTARNREGLSLDEAWLDQYRLPPEEAMRRRLEEWLAGLGEGGRVDVAPEPIESVRESNRVRCDALQPLLRDAVSAWCAKHNAVAPAVWRPESLTFRLDQTAYAEGWGDFAPLLDSEIVAWLEATGRWPQAMPPSWEFSSLGLTQDDLAAQQSARDAKSKREERARRSIHLDGAQVEVDTADFRALAEALAPTLGKVTPQPLEKVAGLESVEGQAGARGGGGPRGVAARFAALSDAQRVGIGFVGELIVREIVRQQYPEFDADSCWKSGYKNAFLGRTDGDDTLGYDFEVPGKRRLLLEVKASTGEDWQFALGESEVREAQRASADRTVRYRIVFVANALDANRRKVITLPNPFSAKGADQLRMVGAGMRFKFAPQV